MSVQARLYEFRDAPAVDVVQERVLERHERTVKALAAAKRGRDAHATRIRLEREDVILRLLGHHARTSSDLYGRYVGASAERGWPIVTYRRFMQYLEVLRERGTITTTWTSQGRKGTVTTVERVGERR